MSQTISVKEHTPRIYFKYITGWKSLSAKLNTECFEMIETNKHNWLHLTYQYIWSNQITWVNVKKTLEILFIYVQCPLHELRDKWSWW
jgi:hypothetical protein